MNTATQGRKQPTKRRGPVGYGVIGAGRRSVYLMQYLPKYGDRVALRGVYDPERERAAAMVRSSGDSNAQVHDDRDALLTDPSIDWVLIASPNHAHKADILAALKAGKHVFAEKPLATTIADCIEIHEAHRQRPELQFATGFVLRYAPMYRRVKQLLDEGAIGEVISVAASENVIPAHGGHIMSCWRRHGELSGSHMLEKCCHDMDLLLWFIGSLPVKVASFGGNDVFVPERKSLLTRFSPPPGSKSVYLEWPTPTRDTQDPFSAEKSIVDNQVAILQFANRVRATFQTTMNNALPERRLYFSGTEGTLIAEMYSLTVEVRRIGHGEPMRRWNFVGGEDHGGGDQMIMAELIETMATGAPVTCGGDEALRSAVVSLGIEEARHTGSVVDLSQTWQELGLNGVVSRSRH